MSKSVTDPSVEAEHTADPVSLAREVQTYQQREPRREDFDRDEFGFAGSYAAYCNAWNEWASQYILAAPILAAEVIRLSEQREVAAERNQPDAETLDHVRNEAYKRGLRATKLFEAHKFLKEANGLWEAFNIWRNRARSAEGKLQKALALLGMTEHDLDNPKPASVPPKSDEVAGAFRWLNGGANWYANLGEQSQDPQFVAQCNSDARLFVKTADLLQSLAQQVQELQSRELDTPRGILRGICGCGQVSLAQIHVHDNVLGHKFVPATAEQLASHILTSKEEIRAKHQVIENLEHEVARLKAEAEQLVEQVQDKDDALPHKPGECACCDWHR
jgi:hypothetical protein